CRRPGALRRGRARPVERAAAGAARVRGRPRARAALERRGARAEVGRRARRARGGVVREGRARGAGGARARRLGHLQRPASAVSHAHGAGGDPLTVAEAYAEVERITRREARNFAYGIRVLPREKRQAISAVYAFARRVDDVADGDLPVTEKRARLAELGASLDEQSDDPMLVA